MSEKGRVVGTAGAAVGLGGFAAALGLCCSVPWAVSLLGVSGAIALARLAFLLPSAVIGAVALLAAGFWFAYAPRAQCADGSCAPPSTRNLRWSVWVAAALVGALSVTALNTGI